VAFVLDWEKLVNGKRIYWVEYRQTTGQQICRFLICDDEFTDHQLDEYEYKTPHGPLFQDSRTGKWYHNNQVTSEYMILDDPRLRQRKSIRFVKHHPKYCNKAGSSCTDLGRSESAAGVEVIGRLIGTSRTHVGEPVCVRAYSRRH
jgi:hypothetical protein